MTKTRIASAILMAVSMAVGSQAMAQDRGGDRDRHYDRRDAPHGAPDHGPSRDMHGRDDRGGGPDHSFRRGGRLPTEYRNRQYVVDDWRGHHLTAPPRGYHWVQTGPDYVLAAIAHRRHLRKYCWAIDRPYGRRPLRRSLASRIESSRVVDCEVRECAVGFRVTHGADNVPGRRPRAS